MGHPVDDAIMQAGNLLAQQWKNPGSGMQPGNDLHPDNSALQFRIKILEDKVATLESTLGKVVRHLNGQGK